MHSHDSPQHDNSKDHGGSFLDVALKLITRISARNPRVTLCFVLLISCAAVGYTATCMKFHTERSDLIDPNVEFQKRWIEYTESFGDSSDIVVVVEGEKPAVIEAALEDLGARLSREPELFTNVLFKADTTALRRKGLQYFRPDQLAAGLNRMADYQPLAQGRWEAARLDFAIRMTDYRLRTALATSDPVLGHFALERAGLLAKSLGSALDEPGKFESPWPEIIPGSFQMAAFTQTSNYLLNRQGTMGFLKAVPAGKAKDDFNGSTKAVDRMREVVAQVAEAHPNVTLGVTGIPVLENDEMRRSQSDMMLASIISSIAVAVLMVVGFRGLRHPILGMIMLFVGMAWTFGYTTLVIGHLNILSVSFTVILIGLGVDFSIHYMARYLELRHNGQNLRPALRDTATGVGAGIITGALTAAFAFLCATFTEFRGVAELGIIAGGGIILCGIATFVVLPAIIALSDQDVDPKKLPTPIGGDWLRGMNSRFPRLALGLSLGLILAIVSQTVDWTAEGGPKWRIHYDCNLLNLQAKGIESVEVQKRIFGEGNDSLLFAVSIADSADEARRLKQQFEALPSVQRVEELASKLPSALSESTAAYAQSYKTQLAGLSAPSLRPPAISPAAVGRAFEELLVSLRRTNMPEAIETARTIDRFLDRFETMSLKLQSEFLASYQTKSSFALWMQLQGLAGASDPTPITAADLPAELTNRFVNRKGQWLVQIFPKEQVWDIEPLTRFVQDVRTVDPEVTGTPLQNFEASRQIRDSYETAALYAFGVICLTLLVDFLGRQHKLLVLGPPLAVVVFAYMMLQARRIEVSPLLLIGSYLLMTTAIAAIMDIKNLRDAMLAMIPPIMGGLMMFGILGLLGIDLNPANLIVLPLLLGIGVDNGVHMIHDFRAQNGRYLTSSSTMNAIALTSLTTIAGFGSLMVAAHRGLYSVGLVLSIGMGTCLFVSLVTLPALLSVISTRHLAEESKPESAPQKKKGDADSHNASHQGQQHQKRKAA